MRRASDFLAGALAGFLVAGAAHPTSRPAPQADRSLERMTTERISPLPSPDFAGLAGTPGTLASASPSPVSPSPTGTRPAATARPRTSTTLRGTATWYCLPGRSVCTAGYPAGGLYAAAGPALRRGAWRGRIVTVTAGGRSVRVRLVDWCACSDGRLIDLYASAFGRLAPLSRGVVPVRVSW